MTDNPSAESDKVSAVEAIRNEMRVRVHRLAWPAVPGESVKGCIRRVSLATGLTFNQVRALWYAEWRRIPADIADKIRGATETHERKLDAQIIEQRARQARLWSLTHQSSDTDFYRGRAGLDGGETD